MKITAYVASAFSKTTKVATKQALFYDTALNENKMAIAKELGFAETAFISDSKIADFRLEYFTPRRSRLMWPRDNWRFHHYEALK